MKIKINLPKEEAIERLSKFVIPTYLKIKGDSLVGHVREDDVELYMAVPFQSNSFMPVFNGAFSEIDGILYLEGKWKYHWFTKIFMLLFSFFVISGVIFGNLPAVAGFIFLLMIFINYRISKKMSINDKKWIQDMIVYILNLPKNEANINDIAKVNKNKVDPRGRKYT